MISGQQLLSIRSPAFHKVLRPSTLGASNDIHAKDGMDYEPNVALLLLLIECFQYKKDIVLEIRAPFFWHPCCVILLLAFQCDIYLLRFGLLLRSRSKPHRTSG